MRTKPSRLALSGMAFACAAILAACGNSSPTVKSVTIAPTNGNIYVSAKPAGGVKGAARNQVSPAQEGVGNTARQPEITINPVTASCKSLQYAATGLLSNGKTQDLTSLATWTSSNTAAATISSAGLATGVGPGMTNIGASYKAVSAMTEPLAVDQLNSISVSPSPASQPQGAAQPFKAIGSFTFAAGNSGSLDVSSQVTWKSSNAAVATIDNTGNATTVGQGTTNITATSCDNVIVSPPAILTVGPAVATSLVVAPAMLTISTGTTTLFTAIEKFSDGTTKTPANPVTWSSSTPAVATIDANTGVALGLTASTTAVTITATESVSGLTGTASLTVQAATARFAYVADAQGGTSSSGTISGYKVDVTAAAPLTSLGSPVGASSPQQVLLHPSGDLMYYINSNGFLYIDDISSADGSFSDSKQNPVQASASTASFNVGVIDPTGRFIYVTSNVDNSIYGFKITQTADKAPATNGALTAVTPTFNPYTPTPALNSPTWIMTDRAGKYVYVVNSGGNSISEFSIDQTTGALSPLPTPTIATDTGPFYGTTDVNGHLYVANQGGTPAVNSVSGYSINSSTGQLTLIGSGPFPINNATFITNVITDPAGKYLYVLDSTAGPPPATNPVSHVFAFNLDPSGSGVIKAPIGTAQLTGNSPTGMAIDPTGVLLAIDNNFDNTISLFTIGSMSSLAPGGLTPTNPTTVATDAQPQFVVFYTAVKGQ